MLGSLRGGGVFVLCSVAKQRTNPPAKSFVGDFRRVPIEKVKRTGATAWIERRQHVTQHRDRFDAHLQDRLAGRFSDVAIRIAERRIERMLAHANLIITARQDGRLVGFARSLTDFCFCCYLSDLAVDKACQGQGIGRALTEASLARAEALVAVLNDAADWKKGADDFKALQTEWKALPSSGKHEKDLIPRFKAPADRFFAARKGAMEERDKSFGANRAAFEDLVKRAEALAVSTEWDKTTAEAKKLQAEWKAVGPIPMREREKLYNKFHKAIDSVFDRYRRRDSIEDEKFQAERAAFLAEMETLASPEAADEAGEDYKNKVADFRARWRKMSGRPSREQDLKFKSLFASLISRNTEAFKGTDMDVDENRKKLEKLVLKLEALEGDKSRTESLDLATRLKEAWAARTMGAKPGANFKAEVEKARAVYDKLGPVLGDEGEALRQRFEAICRKLG